MHYDIIDFKKYTSIHIGGKHKVALIDTINCYKDYFIIGRGHNILMSNNPPKLARLSNEFDYIIQKDDRLIVGAATSSGKLLSFARKNNLANFEFLAKLPGSIGGLTKMNAGLKEWEIFNYIDSIKTSTGEYKKDSFEYTYRHTNIKDIVFEVTFNISTGYDKSKQKMFNTMRDNQPNLPSAGSCFKNPKTHAAGYLIEKVGLKGYQIGQMAFSSIHANFLVNIGGGTYDEAMKLINLAKKKVLIEFEIELETEIVVV